MSPVTPHFRHLSREEIDVFLSSHSHGRLAYAFHNRVDIEPLHYVYSDGWIYGRTAPGTKLTLLQRSPWVAFEVDEVRDLFDWTSVVVRGTIYLVESEATHNVDATREVVVRHLRTLIPDALTDRDPTPDRTVLFRMLVDEAQGRAAQA